MQKIDVLIITVFTFLILLFSACNSFEEPKIVSIEEVEILQATKDVVEINAVMIIDNPNPFALDLDKADMVAIIDDIEVATIQQTYEAKMPPQERFKMPIYLNMEIKKIYGDNALVAIGKGLQMLADRQLEVTLKGNIKVGKGLVKIKIPVDRREVIKF